jgi:cold shock CspA family protein
MPAGTIKKIARVALASGGGRRESSATRATGGYGIIQGEDGAQFYFVDSAVEGCRFDDLSSGQRVEYDPELSPLGRASMVKPVTVEPPQAQ